MIWDLNKWVDSDTWDGKTEGGVEELGVLFWPG